MATWIDASTNVYWYDSSRYSFYPTYIGGGHWTFPGNGGQDFYENSRSPLRRQPIPYTYLYTGENVTVSGIRLYYSFALEGEWPNPNNFQFQTNYARLSTLVTNGMVSGSTMQEWTFDPDIDERITRIIVPWGFGDTYASTAIITKIELRTSIAPDAVWQDYRNTRERISE